MTTALLIAGLFCLSFFFSGTEIALFSLQKLDRKRFADGDRSEQRVLELLGRPTRLLTTILIGNEVTNVTLAATTAALLAQHFPDAPWVNVLVLTPAVILFAEVTPKVVAFRYRQTWSRMASGPISVLALLTMPVRLIVGAVVNALARLAGVTRRADDGGLQEDELRTLVDQGTKDGSLETLERDIVHALFDFGDLTVARLMTPRPDIFSLPTDTPWRTVLARAREAGFSRIPIYAKRPDDIVGILFIKDLLAHRHDPPRSPRELQQLLLPVQFVPGSKPAATLMREFLERKYHMAVVVDEHGTVVGLVTLDDLLAELVGELLDEEDEIRELQPGTWTARASVDLEDFAEHTGIELPQDGEYHTLGGFVFHRLGKLPKRGDIVQEDDVRLIVSRVAARRVEEVRVVRISGKREAG